MLSYKWFLKNSAQIYFLSHCCCVCFSFSAIPALPRPPSPPHPQRVWLCLLIPEEFLGLGQWRLPTPCLHPTTWRCFPIVWCMALWGFSSIIFGKHLIGKPLSSPGLIVCPVFLIRALVPFEWYLCISIKGESYKSTVNYRHLHIPGH